MSLTKIKLRTYVALGLLVVLLPVAIFALFKPQSSTATWMDDSWAYRKKVPVTAHTGAETNKYFSVTVDSSDTTRFQADCGDIRFTDAVGKLLQYYIASGCGTASTVIHVLVPTFPAGATDYYMYYGNPAAPNGFASADFSAGTAVTVGTVASEEKGNGPIIYWSFDEGYGTTAHDGSSNTNDGTLTNGPVWQTEDKCLSGKCLYFDGTNDYVVKTSPLKLPTGSTAFTTQAWVRSMPYASDTTFISWGAGTSGNANWTGLYPNQLCHDFYSNYTCPTVGDLSNGWHFVVVTFDGTTRTIYLDGKSVVSQNPSAPNVSSSSFYVGSAIASGNWFKGYMDEVKIYNYARSAAQVKGDYASKGAPDSSSAQIGTSQKFLSDGLVGYWKFDEASGQTKDCTAAPFTDSSGNGNNGKSCPSTTGPDGGGTGKFGNGIALDGSNDYVEVPNTAALHPGDTFTLSAWVKRSGTGTFDAVFGTVTNDFQLAFVNDNIKVSKQSIGDVFVSTSTYTDTTSWHHIVAVKNGSLYTKVYYDGAEIAGTYTDRTITVGSSPIYIGGDSNAADIFAGSIDEARIYNRALSDSEAKALYNWAPGPVGYWKMDERSGTTAYDTSGNANTGTLTNGPVWSIGKSGSAIKFDGTDDYITVSDNATLRPTNSMSLSAWVYPQAVPGIGQCKGVIDKWITSNFSYQLILCEGGGTIYPDVEISSDGINWSGSVTASSAIPLNTWSYLEFTYNGSTLSMYINGVLSSTSSYSSGVYAGTAPVSIGRRYDGGSHHYVTGLVDEAKIYNYARTANQVVEDMKAGQSDSGLNGNILPTPVSYWSTDEANGTTAHDISINQNDLTLSTATSAWTTSGKTNAAWVGVGTNWLSRADDNDFDLASTDDASISLWFKSTSASNPGSTEYLLAKGGPNSVVGYAIYANTSGQICFGIDDDTTWGPDDSACTTTDIYDATWHHIVAEKTGTTEIRLYVDGVSKATDTSIAATGTLANSSTLYVGDGDGGDNGNEFNGSIDELKFYRSALNVDQVRIDINAGSVQSFGVITPTSEAAQLSDGAGNPPVGYWKLDEKTGTSAADSSGNGFTLDNFTGTPTWKLGKIGGDLSFDGNEDYAYYNESGSTNLDISSSFTLSAWVKYNAAMASQQDYASVIEKCTNASCTTWNYYLSAKDVDGTPDSLGCGFHNGSPQSYYATNFSSPTVGTWYHFECVFNDTANTMTFYVNGTQINQSTGVTATPTSGNGKLTIGGDNANVSAVNADFNGEIDDVKVYDYARTAAQVAYDYNRGGPVGWWQFDECQGTVAYDNSGNGNNGTITNTAHAWGLSNGIGTCNTSSSVWGNATGKFNAGFSSDAFETWVSYTSIDSTLVSYSIWINTTSISDNVEAYLFDTPGYSLYIPHYGSGADGSIRFVSKRATTNGLWITANGVVPQDGLWHLVTVTYDNSSTSNVPSIYFDAKSYSVSTNTSPVGSQTSNAGTARIAKDLTAGTEGWGGTLDDARYYNYLLSSTQIKKLYNGGASINFGPASGQP